MLEGGQLALGQFYIRPEATRNSYVLPYSTLFLSSEFENVGLSLFLSVDLWLSGCGAVTSMTTLPSPLSATSLHKSQRDE